jgi:predicted DCC family thiol-disulfide oxidoreductase YuxK
MDRIKVYYNSACPVCEAGIEGQQCALRERGRGGEVEWIDVHREPERASEVGVELETVRERLHVVGADGALRIGTDAFAVLYGATRGREGLARLLTLPILRQLSTLAYNVFARLLYWWNRALRHW